MSYRRLIRAFTVVLMSAAGAAHAEGKPNILVISVENY